MQQNAHSGSRRTVKRRSVHSSLLDYRCKADIARRRYTFHANDCHLQHRPEPDSSPEHLYCSDGLSAGKPLGGRPRDREPPEAADGTYGTPLLPVTRKAALEYVVTICSLHNVRVCTRLCTKVRCTDDTGIYVHTCIYTRLHQGLHPIHSTSYLYIYR